MSFAKSSTLVCKISLDCFIHHLSQVLFLILTFEFILQTIKSKMSAEYSYTTSPSAPPPPTPDQVPPPQGYYYPPQPYYPPPVAPVQNPPPTYVVQTPQPTVVIQQTPLKPQPVS